MAPNRHLYTHDVHPIFQIAVTRPDTIANGASWDDKDVGLQTSVYRTAGRECTRKYALYMALCAI